MMVILRLFTLLLLLAPIANADSILAGTSLLGGIVDSLAGQSSPVQILLPPNSCPGHYDMRPADVEKAAKCDLLMIQPWQEKMPNVAGLIRAAELPPERVVVVGVPGNWMLPENRLKAIAATAASLIKRYPARQADIEAAAQTLQLRAKATAESVLAEFGKAYTKDTVKAFANQQQADFVRWLGLDVLETFGRAEGMSVAQMDTLCARAKKESVALVVDNLQSGDTKLGGEIAAAAHAPHVVLSNFPGATADVADWDAQIRRNAALVADALARQRARHE